jgi:hypothetical protein
MRKSVGDASCCRLRQRSLAVEPATAVSGAGVSKKTSQVEIECADEAEGGGAVNEAAWSGILSKCQLKGKRTEQGRTWLSCCFVRNPLKERIPSAMVIDSC